MKKHLRSLLCLALAVIMMASLLPMSAAAADNDPTAAYEAFKDLVALRESQVGQPIWDNNFYNIVFTDARDAILKELDSYAFVDLTGDGIKELILKYRVDYDIVTSSYYDSAIWTLAYRYDPNTDSVVKIGESPCWRLPVDDYNWKSYYQDDYMGAGNMYVCTGNDGKVYLADNKPDDMKKYIKFYSFNGVHLAETTEFYATFIHDYWHGIQLNTGKYQYQHDGQIISYDEYYSRLARYAGNGYTKLTYVDINNDAELIYAAIDKELEAYHARKEFNSTNTFVDVAFEDYFAQPVVWAKANGITTGVSDNMFGSGNPCTRGQVVTFLWRAAGQPAPTTDENPFTDVDPNAFYYNAVLWAVENKITTGVGDGKFAPDASCNRGQIVTFLHRAMGEPTASRNYNPFDDVSAPDYFYNAVMWAVEEKITSGTSDTTFAPNDTCTRAQVVTFLYRAYK